MLSGEGLGPANSDACRDDPHGPHCSAGCDNGAALAVALAATKAPGLPNAHLISDVILGTCSAQHILYVCTISFCV